MVFLQTTSGPCSAIGRWQGGNCGEQKITLVFGAGAKGDVGEAYHFRGQRDKGEGGYGCHGADGMLSAIGAQSAYSHRQPRPVSVICGHDDAV